MRLEDAALWMRLQRERIQPSSLRSLPQLIRDSNRSEDCDEGADHREDERQTEGQLRMRSLGLRLVDRSAKEVEHRIGLLGRDE